MSLPIVFFHKGNTPYLPFVIEQTRLFNPGSELILLGDASNASTRGVKHYNIDNYMNGAETFHKYYKHLNNNPIKFELLCFQRWFIIYEFMQQHNINYGIHLDTDLLVYADLEILREKFIQADFTLVDHFGPQSSYINSAEGLKQICEFMLEQFKNPSKLAVLEAWFNERKNCPGGICDMQLLNMYEKAFPGKILNMVDQDGVFDNNFRRSEGFKMKGAHKRIKWKDAIPYAQSLDTNQWKRFYTLHFQGQGKWWLPLYVSRKNISWYLSILGFYTKQILNNFPKFYKKLIQKVLG
jgi:hypothetical protein